MTPKERAEQLVMAFDPYTPRDLSEEIEWVLAYRNECLEEAAEAVWKKWSQGRDNYMDLIRALKTAIEEDEDPTPYCSWCGASAKKHCNCGPRAEND